MNARVRSLFLRQAGVVRRDQAVAAGLSRHQIQRLVACEEWLPVRRGIYRLHAAPPLPETSLWAAALWLGPEALLAGSGAAWWWSLVREAPTTWVFASTLHRRAGQGVRLRDVQVDAEDRAEHRGLPLVAKPWCGLQTAVDLERYRPGSGIALIDRWKQTRQIRHLDMLHALEQHPGSHGIGAMRQLLERTGDDAHSELERLAAKLLRGAGIHGFVVNYRTTLSGGRRVEIDVAFVDRRVAIELDGFAFHADPQAFREDVRRANLLMGDGWTVRRFTYSDLLNDPDGFVEIIAELLRG